jgi:membrane-bound lytic murein transglycosylase B
MKHPKGNTMTTTLMRAIAVACLALFPTFAMADAGFQKWVRAFYPEAARAGITQQTYNAAFSGITEPDPEVLRKAQYQPEFTTQIWDYLDSRVNPYTVRTGKEAEARNMRALQAIERHFGVDKDVLLAIWSMESNYGSILDKNEKLHYVPQALATLAYADPKRAGYARKQLIAALKIIQSGDIKPSEMTGSWAGAMGHTQFIPTSYLLYGFDADGNGKRDIWNSVPDALATAANLLNKNGWQTGRTWGYEVIAPRNAAALEGKSKSIGEWEKLGFRRPGDKGFRYKDERATLKLPGGAGGPAFLMTKNFYVIKRYNSSDSYALGVGLLADRLAGYGGLVQSWPRPDGALDANEKFEIQTRLKALGYYSGEVDGNLGSGSKAAIMAFMQKAGLGGEPEPSKTLLQHLRK